MILKCAKRALDLSTTQVMGILNVTPDSFSDGGRLLNKHALCKDALLYKAEQMLLQGATILDVGGESTRPNAASVSEQQEMDRVLPAIELLVENMDAVISVDTSNAALMKQAAILGAGMLNDVRALERKGALRAAVESQLPVCLMHMQGTPKTMQLAPEYRDVNAQVMQYLLSRAKICELAGIAVDNILLDPGIGFGKTLAQNLQLLKSTAQFAASGYPILIGASRKSLFGQLLQRDVDDRLAGSLASVVYAVMNGAAIVRVHDVKETVDVVNVIQAINRS
jgi:dihydropteroate synthase